MSQVLTALASLLGTGSKHTPADVHAAADNGPIAPQPPRPVSVSSSAGGNPVPRSTHPGCTGKRRRRRNRGRRPGHTAVA